VIGIPVFSWLSASISQCGQQFLSAILPARAVEIVRSGWAGLRGAASSGGSGAATPIASCRQLIHRQVPHGVFRIANRRRYRIGYPLESRPDRKRP